MGQPIERPQPHRWDDRVYEIITEQLTIPAWSDTPRWTPSSWGMTQVISASITIKTRLKPNSRAHLWCEDFTGGFHRFLDLYTPVLPATATTTIVWSIGATQAAPVTGFCTGSLPNPLLMLWPSPALRMAPVLYGRRDEILAASVRYKAWK